MGLNGRIGSSIVVVTLVCSAMEQPTVSLMDTLVKSLVTMSKSMVAVVKAGVANVLGTATCS